MTELLTGPIQQYIWLWSTAKEVILAKLYQNAKKKGKKLNVNC